jgi:hypothetical protein
MKRLWWPLLVIGLAASPAWAVERPHYVVQLSLHPEMQELQVRMTVSSLADAGRRFGLSRGFAVKTMTIDGRAVDPMGPTWPVPTWRSFDIVYTAAR